MTETVDRAVTVQVDGGRVRGRMDGGVAAFLGVPYAAPPFGRRRMQPPERVERWDGERPAAHYGPTCPQAPYGPGDAALFPQLTIPGEDCLNLNVWTPDPGGYDLPVLVWIHGGRFRNGSGSEPWYRGTSFARDGIVCVTINYRLAAEGFLYLDGGPANLGLLDQIAALEWVENNIAGFGGNPGKVTVAGQSAGAMSAATLLAMPRARGLFDQAILQSGAAANTLTAEAAAERGARLAASLGVPPTGEALREVPVARLGEAASALANEVETPPDPARWGDLAFGPVIDGDSLPEHPLDALRKGAAGAPRVLAGWNRDESRIGLVPNGFIDLIDDRVLTAVAGAHGAPDGTVALYRQARPGASSGEVFAAMMTDCLLRVPAIRIAEEHAGAGAADTWMYRFDHPSPSFGGRLGAAHAVELPYVFDLLDDPSSRALIGENPSGVVAGTTHAAWVRFIAEGDPGWPRYDPAHRATALIDERITVVDDPDGAERRVWPDRR